MKTFEQFLNEMAKPLDMHKNIDYYHGASLTDVEINNILKSGFDFKQTELKYEKRPKAPQKPLEDHIYMSTSRAYALVYACLGDFSVNNTGWNLDYEKNKSKFKTSSKAVVFEIDGQSLTDIYPDEDEVGALLYTTIKKESSTLQNYEKELIAVAKTVLSAEQFEKVKKYDSYNDLISAGKKIIYKLSDETKYYIMMHMDSKNLSNKGKLIPKKAYVLDYEDFDKVKTITDFFKIAEVRQ